MARKNTNKQTFTIKFKKVDMDTVLNEYVFNNKLFCKECKKPFHISNRYEKTTSFQCLDCDNVIQIKNEDVDSLVSDGISVDVDMQGYSRWN